MTFECLLVLALGSRALTAAEPAELHRIASEHFTIHSEAFYPPEGLLNDLEGVNAKVARDLILFAPWAKDAHIDLYLYRSSDSYRTQTGAKSWNTGHVDFSRRAIYTFQSDQLRRVLAHELAHLFFDDFFLSASSSPAAGASPRPAPLWLTEGVAVNMEWDYGMDRDDPFVQARAKARLLPLRDFLSFDYHQDAHENRMVSDWYVQAYSLVHFLMRRYPGLLFFTFCDGLRQGAPVDEALRRAYGPIFPDLSALERRWRESLGEK